VIIIKAIIFDFDGTLADTLPICFYAFKYVFKEFDNRDISQEEIVGMFGPCEKGIILKNLLSSDKEKAIEMYYEKYFENHKQLVKKNNEIEDLLKSIKEKGIKLGIVTGKGRRSLDISLKALEMETLFDVIITSEDVENPKPDPEGIIKALNILNVKNDDALFIGDSEADIVAGLKANVYTIGVQWLPNYQTADFVTQPNHILFNINDFNKTLNDYKLLNRC
jgi:phosphoglycolate phosphatase/pyrophosphatase PpaX